MGCRGRKDFQEFVPAKIGFSEIDPEIDVMAGEIYGLFEQFIVCELSNKRTSAGINGKEIEIVSNVVRIPVSQIS